jgi:alpha-1,2-mannosyltransferase
VTFAATVLVGFVVFPGASVRWWTGLVVDTGRMTPDGSAPFNQSIRGVFAQLPGVLHAQWLWLTLAAVVGLAGLAIAVWAGRRGLAPAGIMACALTGLVVSPVSWPHHWVWVVPGLALWLWWARHRHSPAHLVGVTLAWLMVAAAGVLTLLIVVGVPDLSLTGVLMPHSLTAIVLLNSLTVLVALGFIGALAVTLWRADRRSTSDSLPGSASRPQPVRARR